MRQNGKVNVKRTAATELVSLQRTHRLRTLRDAVDVQYCGYTFSWTKEDEFREIALGKYL